MMPDGAGRTDTVRGIQSTEVPRCLTHIVTALKHEGTIYDE
jgi:hypothetical protein